MENCGGGYHAFCPISNHSISSSCVNDLTWTRVWSKPVTQDELAPLVQAQNLTLSFSSESSIQEELKRESTADAITILVSTYVGMVFHMTLGWLIHFSYIFLIKSMRLFYITLFLPTYLYLWGTPLPILVYYEESCWYVNTFAFCSCSLFLTDKLSCDVCLHIYDIGRYTSVVNFLHFIKGIILSLHSFLFYLCSILRFVCTV